MNNPYMVYEWFIVWATIFMTWQFISNFKKEKVTVTNRLYPRWIAWVVKLDIMLCFVGIIGRAL